MRNLLAHRGGIVDQQFREQVELYSPDLFAIPLDKPLLAMLLQNMRLRQLTFAILSYNSQVIGSVKIPSKQWNQKQSHLLRNCKRNVRSVMARGNFVDWMALAEYAQCAMGRLISRRNSGIACLISYAETFGKSARKNNV